ncbi:MAG: hypothetical protein AB7Q45_06530, partial [Planctomycetaceae bacterium]
MRSAALSCVLCLVTAGSLRAESCCPESPGGGYAWGKSTIEAVPGDHVRVEIAEGVPAERTWDFCPPSPD